MAPGLLVWALTAACAPENREGFGHNSQLETIAFNQEAGVLFAARWSADTIALRVDGAPGPLLWGMAETHPACGVHCWLGEDCADGGFDGDGVHHAACHPLQAGRGELQLGATPATFEPGVSTVFWTPRYVEAVTHVVISATTGRCWTFGHDPQYFQAEGCTIVEDDSG